MAQNGPDEAARLEAALARIARAASIQKPEGAQHRNGAGAEERSPPRNAEARNVQTGYAADGGEQGLQDVAHRLDRLIADLRGLLGPQEF